MERARSTWTDERLDDLSRRVEDGFNRVDEDLRALRGDLGSRVDGVEARIDSQTGELSQRIDFRTVELSQRIDSLQRTMIQIGATTTFAILATLVSVIATRG